MKMLPKAGGPQIGAGRLPLTILVKNIYDKVQSALETPHALWNEAAALGV